MYKIVTILILLSFNAFAITLNAEKHVKMNATALEINANHYLVISLKNDEHWHTYWKNPGDAGLEIKFEFLNNQKLVELEALEWPAPKRYIEAGDILAYGYSDTHHFFYKLPQSLKEKELQIKGTWLVCKDICIPGQDELILDIDQDLNGSKHQFKISNDEIIKSLAKLPQKADLPNNIEIYLTKTKKENQLALQYTLTNFDISKFDTKANLVTPFLQVPFDYKHEKLFYDVNNNTLYGRMYIDWDGLYEDPEIPLPKNGIFKNKITAKFLLQYNNSKNASIVEHTFSQFSVSTDEALETFFKTLTPIEKLQDVQSIETNQNNIFYFILFAFIGGLILNLMPCVLPVISLKLFGLVAHSAESKKKILKHNLAYTFGVISSFMVLAIVILILKSSGEKIGWGFQLQSPGFVFTMMGILFVMALNMLGLFEFMTPGGKVLGNTQIKKGLGGDVINGVLATILSTPCSAPFLGTALTFAFTTGTVNIFLIFFFVGLGLSFPFILTGIFPQLISFLPKPGAWMNKLKNILGFTLLITFVWLYDVLMNIIDFNSFGIYINSIFTLIFIAFFFRKHISKLFVWNIIFFSFPIILTANLFSSNGLKPYFGQESTSEVKTMDNLNWNKWSTESMQKLAKEKKWVFIDFTAKWCLTCKVNKKLVFDTSSFSKFIEENQIELLLADWTKRDDYITDFLNKYNIVGVPAYFLQKPNGEIIHLGETVSISKIKENMK